YRAYRLRLAGCIPEATDHDGPTDCKGDHRFYRRDVRGPSPNGHRSVESTKADKVCNISRNVCDIVETQLLWAVKRLNQDICCSISLNLKALSARFESVGSGGRAEIVKELDIVAN